MLLHAGGSNNQNNQHHKAKQVEAARRAMRGSKDSSRSRNTGHLSHSLDADRRDSCEGDGLNDLTLGKLPPKTEHIKADSFLKLCQGEWQIRYVVLTQTEFIIALPDSDQVSDRIPLHEIKLVTKVQEDSNELITDTFGNLAFNLHTIPDGYNCGRVYCFRTAGSDQFEDWLAILVRMSKDAARKHANRTLVEAYRLRARKLTSSNLWQRTNSLLVAANLVVIVAQSQALPLDGSYSKTVFDGLDIVFTTMFSIELIIHLFAYWLWPFFSDGWLVFDFVVVTISLVSLIFTNLPGVTILRLMRTFRVLRLFNRLRSLRTLINALAASLIPVLNAFLMVILVNVIYSIMGVELFSEHNPERFGSFALSYWTVPRGKAECKRV